MLAICICKISFSYTKRLAFSLFYKKIFNSNGYILKIKGIYLKNMLIVNSQGCALRKIEGLDSPVFWNCNWIVQRMLFMKKKKKKNYSSLISQEQKEGARGHQVLLRAKALPMDCMTSMQKFNNRECHTFTPRDDQKGIFPNNRNLYNYAFKQKVVRDKKKSI